MRNNSQALFLGIVFLFLLQTISDFIESIYAFGLLQTSFTIEIVSILLFFAPLALLFFRRGVKRPVLLGLALVGLVCRVAGSCPFLVMIPGLQKINAFIAHQINDAVLLRQPA